jgi:hypothetical protein
MDDTGLRFAPQVRREIDRSQALIGTIVSQLIPHLPQRLYCGVGFLL